MKIAKAGAHMAMEEWSQLCAAITILQPKTVLEWGSGGSTTALLHNFSFIQKLVSIEHDARWFEHVKSETQDSRLELVHIAGREAEPPAPLIYSRFCARDKWRKNVEKDPLIFKEYIDFPLSYGALFDLILIDGRARNFCLTTGWECLNSGGVMLLHDAQRTEYQSAIASLPNHLFLTPWSRGQFCLFVKP